MAEIKAGRIALEAGWKKVLLSQFGEQYMLNLRQFLVHEKLKGKAIYPPSDQWFAAFDATPFDRVKVVILGQDPYHGRHQAHGLCFSVNAGIPAPPSLKNIFAEVSADLENESRTQVSAEATDLTRWARQGVLLLNSVLTVEHGKAGSHRGRGWEQFTDHVVRQLAFEKEHLVFMLWGNYAQQKGSCIDRLHHLVLTAPHPSPFSASSGFFGCRHFSRCNQYLKEHNKTAIDWLASE